MLTFVKILLLSALALASPANRDDCPASCKLPNCLCASTNIPGGLTANNIPQIVYLTFDDAVTQLNNEYYKFFDGKRNPDGCPISATFFIAHEYCDYTIVHDLYEKGHEIALHSITHTTNTEYWKTASVDLLKKEFGGERDLVAYFANIPAKDIVGLRMPFLQMDGNNQTKAMTELGLKYDCSWPTHTYMKPGLWPYTLDYPSMQDCNVGPCPTDSAPGIWLQPMINWSDNNGVTCAMSDACVNIPTDVDGLFNFMMENFNIQYKGNRAPFGFYIHAAWFATNANHFLAYKKFVEELVKKNDVYIVNIARGLEYAKNPKPLDKIKEVWPKCNEPKQTTCTPKSCQLLKGEETRYMMSCATDCPKVYPWLGNPFGK